MDEIYLLLWGCKWNARTWKAQMTCHINQQLTRWFYVNISFPLKTGDLQGPTNGGWCYWHGIYCSIECICARWLWWINILDILDNIFYGLFTLPDSDSDLDSKPNGYIALCRCFQTVRSKNQIPILTANYRNGIRIRVHTRVRLRQCK